jgi:hypothetical protein
MGFFDIGSHELFAQAGFEPQFSWFLLLEKLGLEVWATGIQYDFSFFDWTPASHSGSCWSWDYSPNFVFCPYCPLTGRSDDISVNMVWSKWKSLEIFGDCNSCSVWTWTCQKFWSGALESNNLKPFSIHEFFQTCQSQAVSQRPGCWFASREGAWSQLDCSQRDAMLHCSVEILLELNQIKGQLYPDETRRKHNCIQSQSAMYPTNIRLLLFLWIVNIKNSVACLLLFHCFIYPVDGKKQLGNPVYFSLKVSHFWPSCRHCFEA